MGIVTLPNLGPDPITVNASVLNGKVDPLATEFNGGIDNDNIASGAGIVYSKLTLTGGILNADINASAGIVDTKLATISTAGKVAATAISVSGLTAVTGVSTDYLVISDVSDSGNPKKALASDFTFTPSTSNALSKSTIQTVFTKSSAVATSTGTAINDDTIPTLTECPVITALDTAITASSASNTLIITATLNLATNTANYAVAALFIDAATDASAAVLCNPGSGNANFPNTVVISFSVAPADTSAHTYKIGIGGISGIAVTVNGTGSARKMGGVMYSTVRIDEIKA